MNLSANLKIKLKLRRFLSKVTSRATTQGSLGEPHENQFRIRKCHQQLACVRGQAQPERKFSGPICRINHSPVTWRCGDHVSIFTPTRGRKRRLNSSDRHRKSQVGTRGYLTGHLCCQSRGHCRPIVVKRPGNVAAPVTNVATSVRLMTLANFCLVF